VVYLTGLQHYVIKTRAENANIRRKATAIRYAENGLKTKSLIAKEFVISYNNLSTYLKNKENILSKFTTSSKKGRNRARKPDNPDFDECVYKWFKPTPDNIFH